MENQKWWNNCIHPEDQPRNELKLYFQRLFVCFNDSLTTTEIKYKERGNAKKEIMPRKRS